MCACSLIEFECFMSSFMRVIEFLAFDVAIELLIIDFHINQISFIVEVVKKIV